MSKSTEEIRAEIEAQGELQPGEAGWWQVWGASPRDIEGGDYVLLKTEGGVDEFYVAETYRCANHGMQYGIIVDGVKMTLGALSRITILRPGTKSTLSGSVR